MSACVYLRTFSVCVVPVSVDDAHSVSSLQTLKTFGDTAIGTNETEILDYVIYLLKNNIKYYKPVNSLTFAVWYDLVLQE